MEAGAARLAELAAELGVQGADLQAWQPVLEAFAQSSDREAREAYARDVLRVLQTGARTVAEDGTVIATIDPHPEIVLPATFRPYFSADYGPAIFRSSPNYNSRGGTPVSLVVIHSCEGNYAGCWGWLRNPDAGASAHYVVKEDGSEITQLVTESNRAWHVAASYECSRAGGAQCNRNGVSTNTFSVGIEHAGFGSQASWATGLIEASAKLTCDITRSHGVPRDRNHIVSHGQLQPWNRTDPGPNWPWSHYIDRVRAHCGDTSGSEIIVDSNNANNNAAVARIELTGTWTSSSANPGYYGSGYWYANTAPVSEPASFLFYLPAAATKTIDAWWVAAPNRSTAATFIAKSASDAEVGRKTVSQQQSGSQWVTLGTWSFSAGWNQVQLSRWAAAGSVVIADAIRVR
jgi:N-acetyl-anhydromuramyl-L-alanine amidase AmpD